MGRARQGKVFPDRDSLRKLQVRAENV